MRATTIRDMVNSPASLIRLNDGEKLVGWVDSIDLPRCAIRFRTKLNLVSGERFQITIKGLTEKCDFIGRLLNADHADDARHLHIDGAGSLSVGEQTFEFVQDGVVVFGKSNESPRKALHEHFATLEWAGMAYEAALAEVGLDLAVLVVPLQLNPGDELSLSIMMNRKREDFTVVVEVIDLDPDYQGLYRMVVRAKSFNRLEAAAWRRLLSVSNGR